MESRLCAKTNKLAAQGRHGFLSSRQPMPQHALELMMTFVYHSRLNFIMPPLSDASVVKWLFLEITAFYYEFDLLVISQSRKGDDWANVHPFNQLA